MADHVEYINGEVVSLSFDLTKEDDENDDECENKEIKSSNSFWNKIKAKF